MAVALKLDFVEPVTEYDQAVKTLGFTDGHGAEGILFHWVEQRDGTFTVHDIWESQEQADAFFARLQELGVPMPAEVQRRDVYNYMRPAL